MSIVESINREISFNTIEHKSEAETGIEWCLMHHNPRADYRPCFSEPLLVELRECQRQIAARVPTGNSVTIMIPGQDWCKVTWNGYTGYMLTYFLQQ